MILITKQIKWKSVQTKVVKLLITWIEKCRRLKKFCIHFTECSFKSLYGQPANEEHYHI